MKNSAYDNCIGRNPVENYVLSVNELMGPAFVEATHARIVGDQLKDGIQLAQILLRLPLA